MNLLNEVNPEYFTYYSHGPQTFIEHLLCIQQVLVYISKQDRLKQKQNKKHCPRWTFILWRDDVWMDRKRKGVTMERVQREAYLVFQASFEIANKISRLVALKLSTLHWLATQIVIHLNSKDGSCRAFILSTLLSWNSEGRHFIDQARKMTKAEFLIRKAQKFSFNYTYINTTNSLQQNNLLTEMV